MTTDELYIESFKVGDKYDELRNKVVNNVIDKAYERVVDDEINRFDLAEIVTDEGEEWLVSFFAYQLYVTLHFGIYDVVEGCDYEDSPSYLFLLDVQERVESLLKDDGVEIID